MLLFHLFRIKVHFGPQRSLFSVDESRASIIFESINSKPSAELRKGYVWHVGNVIQIADTGIYFALGRTTKSIVERYDDKKGNFIEEEFETAPYTHALVDLDSQVLAIAKKTRLMPTVKGIANQLGRLLIRSTTEASNGTWKIDISQINDPDDFIYQIREAYSVNRFSIDFGLPNPWDVERDFQKPMEELLSESDGTKGKTTINGEDLNRKTLEHLTRSAASTGNDAQAIIKMDADSKRVFRRLSGNPATLQKESLDNDEDKLKILSLMRRRYKKLRFREEGELD
jgi:hypothetical protein